MSWIFLVAEFSFGKVSSSEELSETYFGSVNQVGTSEPTVLKNISQGTVVLSPFFVFINKLFVNFDSITK